MQTACIKSLLKLSGSGTWQSCCIRNTPVGRASWVIFLQFTHLPLK